MLHHNPLLSRKETFRFITVDGNKYKFEKDGMSDFALIGLVECILTDLNGMDESWRVCWFMINLKDLTHGDRNENTSS